VKKRNGGRTEEGQKNREVGEARGGNNEGMQQDASKHASPHSPQPQPPHPPPLNLNIHPSQHQNSRPMAEKFALFTPTTPTHSISGILRWLTCRCSTFLYSLLEEHRTDKWRQAILYILVKCYIGFCTQGAL
jgi:hypothetical protein